MLPCGMPLSSEIAFHDRPALRRRSFIHARISSSSIGMSSGLFTFALLSLDDPQALDRARHAVDGRFACGGSQRLLSGLLDGLHLRDGLAAGLDGQIGKASGRDRGCEYGEVS